MTPENQSSNLPTTLPDHYHVYGKDRPLKLVDFGQRWGQEGKPKLTRVWRDCTGGWIWYLLFQAESDGTAHALYLPNFWKGSTEKEKLQLRALIANYPFSATL